MSTVMLVLLWVARGLLIAAIVTVGQLMWADAAALLRRSGVSGRG